MTTCGYDYEVNCDLMPKIMALTEPPASVDKSAKYKGNRKIKKSSGLDSKTNGNSKSSNGSRWFNHEFCDYCREGGDVLCCDRCPATFHLECNEPPLDEDEIPEGEYFCRSCQRLEKKQKEEMEAYAMRTKSESRSETSDVAANGNAIKPIEGSSSIRVDYAKAVTASDGAADNEDNAELDKNGNIRALAEEQPSSSSNDQNSSVWSHSNPLSMLIEAAEALNPQQFELPPEYTSSIPLPGAPKRPPTHNSRKKLPHELDNNGLVPFPVKTCFQCRRSCKKAPLIQCDFCTLLYHADCLDPPLTALPSATSKWICPAHSEHIIDQKLLTSTRLTERVKLWNQFNGRIDENAIKLTFLKKVYEEPEDGPSTGTKRVYVPESIKSMYRNPPDLSISTSYHYETSDVEVSRVLKRQQLVDNNVQPPSAADLECYLTGIVQMQSSIAEYMTKASSEKSSDSENKRENVNKSIHSWMDDVSYMWKKVDDDNVKKEEKESPELIAQGLSTIENKLASAEISPNDLDETMVEKLDIKLVKALALQRLRQLVPPNKKVDDTESNAVATCNTTVIRKFVHGEIKARALLCPVYPVLNNGVTERTAIETASYPMRYRSFTIGLTDGNDLVLSKYGHCNFVSEKHACIYFDEITQNYELINYSEHGTYVDNVLYSLDFSSDLPAQEIDTPKKLPLPTLQRTEPNNRGQNAKKKGFKRKKSRLTKPPKKSARKPLTNSSTPTKQNLKTGGDSMCAGTLPTFKECACQSSASILLIGSGAGWEGAAVLNHGSHIKFGCIEFVFGITAFTNQQEQPNDETSAISGQDDPAPSDVSTTDVFNPSETVESNDDANQPVEKMEEEDV